MLTIKKRKDAAPGEKVAVIEEFEAGEGTYLNGEAVRARALGHVLYDLKRRVITIQPTRPFARIPSPGDEVVGQVEASQANIANVRIYYINGKRSSADFTGMIITRPIAFSGRMRSRELVICKPGDLIKAKVVSNVNAIIHLSIDEDNYGVIYTVCSLCGGKVTRINNRIKCIECNHVEDRKLTSEFGKVALHIAS